MEAFAWESGSTHPRTAKRTTCLHTRIFMLSTLLLKVARPIAGKTFRPAT
jgi:hypothetical protein